MNNFITKYDIYIYIYLEWCEIFFYILLEYLNLFFKFYLNFIFIAAKESTNDYYLKKHLSEFVIY